MPPPLPDPAIHLKRRLTVRYGVALVGLVVLLVGTFFIGRGHLAALRRELDELEAVTAGRAVIFDIRRIAEHIADGHHEPEHVAELRRHARLLGPGRAAQLSQEDPLIVETRALGGMALRLAEAPEPAFAAAVERKASDLVTQHYARLDSDGRDARLQLEQLTQMSTLLLVAWLCVLLLEIAFVFLPGLRLIGRHIEDYTRARRLERQLRSARRMRVLGRMAGGMAHEFNNILMPIVGLSDLLQDRTEPGSEDRRLIDMLVEAGDRARQLVARVRVLDRPLSAAPVDVDAVIADALALCGELPGIERVEVEVAAEARRLRVDGGALAQAIAEVVRNALAAIGPTGRVEITAECEEPGDPLSATLIRIIDDGHGMSPPVREAAFDPFFTTRTVGDGVGLGLSVVHGIVTAHGGRVDLQSVVDRGTVVTMYIPADVSTSGDEA
ncbi:MAG: hypothetical protein H6705_20545 [Myxococcales bacterium]|nr:hypothetical protein [Myxococcales bacterium]